MADYDLLRGGVSPISPLLLGLCTYPGCTEDINTVDAKFCKDHTTLMHAQQAIFKIWEKSFGCYVIWPNVQAKQKAFLDFYTTRILTLENYEVKVE